MQTLFLGRIGNMKKIGKNIKNGRISLLFFEQKQIQCLFRKVFELGKIWLSV